VASPPNLVAHSVNDRFGSATGLAGVRRGTAAQATWSASTRSSPFRASPAKRLAGAGQRKNRNTACPSSPERPPGKQCDEYPFPSTWQSASSYSRRMINGPQNEDGGRTLSRFYLYSRIIEKDRFLVWIK
jgi:hypothetical protein